MLDGLEDPVNLVRAKDESIFLPKENQQKERRTGVPVLFEDLTTILGEPCLLEDPVNLVRAKYESIFLPKENQQKERRRLPFASGALYFIFS